ncbi:hypothetical protein H261_19209 [Paramagnetospirillum caucaseum]|uniref:Uncharacterized protein n=1 Tax=Paramagnetospirillum caucaseum TaxID=1244869 RepID=M2Z1U8_9PROT|nr:hypothetical protein [Paramagnetospirillum caucaseum]EME68270.1 hypothetical protein H261_19209 [Paramagnetospirillum caucaseum]
MAKLNSRIMKLETAQASGPTHEEALAALLRVESPPFGYTDIQRTADIETLRRDDANLAAAGLG